MTSRSPCVTPKAALLASLLLLLSGASTPASGSFIPAQTPSSRRCGPAEHRRRSAGRLPRVTAASVRSSQLRDSSEVPTKAEGGKEDGRFKIRDDIPRDESGRGRPTLYHEAERMVLVSFCGYSLTQLRREAKAGKLKNNRQVLDLLGGSAPARNANGDDDGASAVRADTERHIGRSLAVADLLDIVNDNWDYLKAKFCEDLDGYSGVDAFRHINFRAQAAGVRDSITLEDFNDDDESRKLVYGIAMDRNERRITLLFRGTYPEGTSDWARNFQFEMKKVPTPQTILDADKRAPDHVMFHRGFYEYMFDNQDKDYPKERYEEIVDVLKPLVQRYPDFKLYITGHSLGGALATLTAYHFAASSDPAVPHPVNVVTCGSPLVGDENFRAAFQILEAEGRIRHLRISNHEDCIPKGWPFSIPDRKLFKHVGVNLELMPGTKEQGEYKIDYRKIWPGKLALNDGLHWPKFTTDPAGAHGVSEYLRRVLQNREELMKYDLDDIYSDSKNK